MGIDSYKGVTQLDVILPSNTDVRTDDIGNDFIEENVPLENCVDYSKTVSQLKSTEIKEKIIQSTVHGFNRQETHQTNYDVCYPKDAKYFIDHVVYLPVHKDVPFADLKTICEAVKMASPKIQDQQYNYIHDLKSKL